MKLLNNPDTAYLEYSPSMSKPGFFVFQTKFDLAHPECLIDALYRHSQREKKANGQPKIDEVDIHMITRDAIGAGWYKVSTSFL